MYEIILYSREFNGNGALSQDSISVDGGMIIGVVDIPAPDMSDPAQGLSRALDREHHSRDFRFDDFRPGWNLPSSNVKTMTIKSLGGEWGQEPIGGFVPSFALIETLFYSV